MTTPLSLSIGAVPQGSRGAVELAQRLEGHAASAWGAEVVGPDAFSVLGAVAATTDLPLGVAVVPAQTRSPFTLAMSAMSLAALTGGRFVMGIGASSPPLVDRFGGVAWEDPLGWVRETAEAIRPVLAGGRTTFAGDHVRIGGYRYPNEAPAPVPLYFGSLNRRSLRMTGELADGLCLNQFAPHHLPAMLAEVRAGAAEAGRTLPADFPVMARLFCAVTDDLPAARSAVRRTFASYVATPGYNRFYAWMGYEDTAATIAEAAATGDRDAMVEAMTDEVVDDLFLLGDADAVAERVEEYVAQGVTVPALEMLAPSVDAAEQMYLQVAAARG